jgi:hypothetical protein
VAPASRAESDALAQARALFEEGDKAMQEGRKPEACAKFRQSYEQSKRVNTAARLADCAEGEGRLVEAARLYGEIVTLLEQSGEAGTPKGREKLEAARQRAAEIEPRVPKLTVRLGRGAPAAARVFRSARPGDPLAPIERLGAAERLDPGRYRVVVRAPGFAEGAHDVALAEGGAREIEVAPGAALAAEAPPEAPPAGGDWMPIAGLVAGGVGIVGLALGAAFGAVAISKQDEAEPHCREGEICDADGIALRDEAITAATVSTAAFIAGGVLVAGGLVLVLAAPSGEAPASAALELGPGAIGVRSSW